MHIVAVATPSTHRLIALGVAGRDVLLDGPVHIWSRQPSPLDPDVFLVESSCMVAPAVLQQVRRYLLVHPNIALVLIGHLSQPLVEIIRDFGSQRALEVSVLEFDGPERAWAIIRRAYSINVAERVVLLVRPRLANVPERMRIAVEQALLGHPLLRTIPDVARFANYDARSVYRHLTTAGIAHPKDVIRVGTLLPHLPRFYERGTPLHRLAKLAGFQRYTDFQRRVHHYFGSAPRRVRHDDNPERIAPAVVAALFTSAR